MEIAILDFNSPEILAKKMAMSERLAIETKPAMDEIAIDLFRIERIIFDSQGRRGGGSWAQLKYATIDRKGSAEILRGTESASYDGGPGDALFKSLTEPNAPYQILHVSRNLLMFGTDRPFAGVHQTGSSKRGIPARPFIRVLSGDTERWGNIALKHVVRPFTPSGGVTNE